MKTLFTIAVAIAALASGCAEDAGSPCDDPSSAACDEKNLSLPCGGFVPDLVECLDADLLEFSGLVFFTDQVAEVRPDARWFLWPESSEDPDCDGFAADYRLCVGDALESAAQ